MSKFAELGLAEQVLRGIEKSGYDTPTPIQERAIPPVLAGGDLTGSAQTGTGKTAAFVLPILSRLVDSRSQNEDDRSGGRNRRNHRGPRVPVRALILAPTRELAVQVKEAVEKYGSYTGLRSVAIYGGVGMHPQISALRRGVDIVIATPGRLLDHIGRRNIDLGSVETFVLDEADRMFDMGFINDVKKIVGEMPSERQTLLFSATMPSEIEKLARQIQKNPEMVEIGNRTNAAESVTQKVCGVLSDRKVDLLLHILKNEPSVGSTLVFTRTKFRADKVAKRLNTENIPSVAIHSNRTQSQRQRGLEAFARGKFQVMVATDIAARGLDVDGITHVINLDCPGQPEDYIHRIGRTGRASETGEAWTFISPEEKGGLRSIERTIKKKIDRVEIEGLTIELYDSRGGSDGGYQKRGARTGGGDRSRSNRSRRGPSNGGNSRFSKRRREESRSGERSERGRGDRSRTEGVWTDRDRSESPRSERPSRSEQPRSEKPRWEGSRPDRENSEGPRRKKRRPSSSAAKPKGNRAERRAAAGITQPTGGEEPPKRKKKGASSGYRKTWNNG